ncbi:MAG: DUF5662 family protein [Elusimicrobiota bacterium]
MNWYKKAINYFENWDKMKDWFEKRTNNHIKSVQDFCKKIYDYDSEKFKGIIERGEKHDQSKFKDPEIDPYIYITWKYKCQDDGKDFNCPEDIDGKMQEATEHHVLSNRHHPEFHDGRKNNIINKNDRDAPPDKIIDAASMSDLDIAEMVADWCAVGKERGNSPKSWADKNINVRWKFDANQKKMIYELIDAIGKSH